MGHHHQRHDIGQQKERARRKGAGSLADQPTHPEKLAQRLVRLGKCSSAILDRAPRDPHDDD